MVFRWPDPKLCSKCKETKPLRAFGWRKVGSPKSWCKACDAARMRVHRKKKTEKEKRQSIRLSRKAKSFWSATKFNREWRKQFGLCKICNAPMTELRLGSPSAVHADHDPVMNMPRGLLCQSCNVGLGQFKDDPHLLERAADYLQHHSGSHHH